ncbi:hypothetical protein ACOSP7_030223 [Xanthoceras sorbifolium]
MASSSFNVDFTSSSTGLEKVDYASLAKTLNSNQPLKLDKSNYIFWKTQVLPAIRSMDLEDYIDSSVPQPQRYIEVHTCNESGEISTQQQLNPFYVIWKKTDQILLCWLLSTVSPSVLGQVTQCKTAIEAWSKLQRVYSQQSMVKILQLRQQLQSVKKGADSISDFVLKIKNIGDAMLGAGEAVNEKDLLLSLMSGVGHKYDPVVVLIANQHKTMSLEDTQFMLLMHEHRIEQLNTATQISIGGASAHYASSSNKGNNNIRGGYNNAKGGNRSRGRGGRYGNRSGQKIHCQLCAKP